MPRTAMILQAENESQIICLSRGFAMKQQGLSLAVDSVRPRLSARGGLRPLYTAAAAAQRMHPSEAELLLAHRYGLVTTLL